VEAGWERALTPEFRKSMPLFARLDGPILDAPCGYGRHALSLQELGCMVTCADLDDKALEQLSQLNKTFAKTGQNILQTIKLDLINGEWPFEENRFSGALNVHFYERKLIENMAHSLASGGLLYIETVANRKGNFIQLPKLGEIRNLLAGAFELLHMKERHAGPAHSQAVTVRMLARKL
jgi:SAM-dependent methyltransferase